MSVTFTVPGVVRGKGRPRAARRGAFVRMYTDEKTVSYENLVKLAAVQAMASRTLLEGPLTAILRARFAPPASVSKVRQAAMLAGSIRPTTKPDLDNIAKVLDGLNGIVFKDDAQIVSLMAVKIYAEAPGLDVEITPA